MPDFKKVLQQERARDAKYGEWAKTQEAPAERKVVLSPRQQAAVDAALSGKHCFITGPGGVGKSEVSKAIVRALRARGKEVAVTASTGIAAVAIEGMTIHSLLGTGIAGSKERWQRRMGPNSVLNAEKRLYSVDTILVDEISMLTGDYVDMAQWWLGMVTGDGSSFFGGKQMIFVGDFLQLPPVVTNTDTDKVKNRYAFQSEVWSKLDMHDCYLNKSFRQDNADFVKHLNRIRRGVLPEDTIEFFRPCVGRELEDPTRLFPTNSEAFNFNMDRLEKLPGQSETFVATFDGDERWYDALKNNCIADEVLELKVGAPVIFIQNLPGVYVNGQRGTVVEMTPTSIQVEKSDGTVVSVDTGSWEITNAQERVLAKMMQVPLKLAWAITMHKSQGMSLERVSIDLSRTFESGMSYVSLSRAKSLEGLSLASPLEPGQIITSKRCVQYYAELAKRMKDAES